MKTAGIGVAGSMLARRGALALAADSATELVAGKDPRLIVHAAKPAVLETPPELLAAQQVTPTSLAFVRNSQQLAASATTKPLSLDDWKIEIAGLVDHPLSLEAKSLSDMDQVEHEMVVQCSGNGRSLFSQAAPTKGTQWGRGGMSNVRFAGVPLAKIIERRKITVKPEAKYVTAEGKDDPQPGEQDFEHSIPLDEALKKSFLALQMNGEPLPAIHGGPVRLVTPGYYGTMHIKWLSTLRFESHESNHTSQMPHYRTPLAPIKPGQAFTATYENSEPNWRMKLKCVVLSPSPGAKLAREASLAGVAFNDGEARIASVLVSPDAGQTWRRAELETPKSPYAWYRWKATLQLAPGKRQIWALAIDSLGRSQPVDGSVFWNPSGYTWNGVEKIDVVVG